MTHGDPIRYLISHKNHDTPHEQTKTERHSHYTKPHSHLLRPLQQGSPRQFRTSTRGQPVNSPTHKVPFLRLHPLAYDTKVPNHSFHRRDNLDSFKSRRHALSEHVYKQPYLEDPLNIFGPVRSSHNLWLIEYTPLIIFTT